MFQKYRLKSDNELVFEYKKTKQDDLEYEIISRYQNHARLLAGLLFSKFKFLYQVEYDDIYCILLGSLSAAINGFNNDGMDFYHYWKSTATHDVLLYVNKFSSKFSDDYGEENYASNEEPILAGYMKEKTSILNDDYLSSFELDDILRNPKNKFKELDINIFYLYLAGYSIYEIAELMKTTYNKVRYRISNVKRKIANILFNQ